MEERNKGFAGKKVAVIAATVLAVALSATTLLVLEGQQSALAQSNSNYSNTTSSATSIPQLHGSVSIQNATNAFVKNNIKVSFTDAANTARGQVPNGVVIGGRLSEVQGYLVYTFKVANYDAGTMKIVIVDAGNGTVLYTSNDLPLMSGGIGGGCPGGHGGWMGGAGQHNGFGLRT
jgi:uncharacterized membrane protein YkoI